MRRGWVRARLRIVYQVKPVVAITAGDPAGIGPEIAAAAAADPSVRTMCEPRIYQAAEESEVAGIQRGRISAAAGRAAYDAITRAVADALRGDVQAVATAPINKAAFAAAGLPWKGHTDLLAHLTGVQRGVMMFYSEALRVVLATVHIPLAEVASTLDSRSSRDGDPSHRRRAAAIRISITAAGAGGPQSACRRGRASRH